MLAGESVFLLPFVLVRIFRPTFLNSFDLTNLELGTAFSVYGTVAMLSYFLGGPIADRFSARKLLSSSLFLTAAGGLVLGLNPSLFALTLLYAFWGISSILLFWAAFIKAIRIYGGEAQMGRAYGWVDAGRGVVAAAMASASVALYDYLLPEQLGIFQSAPRVNALIFVIYAFSFFTVIAGLLIWLIMPKDDHPKIATSHVRPSFNWQDISRVSLNSKVWWQAIVVLCAYVAYKSTDDISLYGTEVLQMDEVTAGHLASLTFWIRPIGALIAGYLGDRFGISRMCKLSFALVIMACISLSIPDLISGSFVLIIMSIAIGSLGIYGLRGLYFALFKENEVSLKHTGVAVGLISVIGYSPDVFFGPLMGWLLDHNPGQTGHQHLFMMVAAFGIIGLFASSRIKM